MCNWSPDKEQKERKGNRVEKVTWKRNDQNFTKFGKRKKNIQEVRQTTSRIKKKQKKTPHLGIILNLVVKKQTEWENLEVARENHITYIQGNADKIILRDFPGGPVVKNPPYNAGDVDSIPGQRTKIPHAAGQLSPWATTTELMCLN